MCLGRSLPWTLQQGTACYQAEGKHRPHFLKMHLTSQYSKVEFSRDVSMSQKASPSRTTPSTSFNRALNEFKSALTPEDQDDFSFCDLEALQDTILAIQSRHGSQRSLRNMGRLQKFLEAMDQYRKVVEAFLNCTPFMGFVWACKCLQCSIGIDAYSFRGQSVSSCS